LQASLRRLEGAWGEVESRLAGRGLGQVAARETASLLATARWSTAAALKRRETRGLHLRDDAPELAPDGARRLLVGGLDAVWTRYEAAPARARTEAAA
jgi:succinate dehydrogenase/fumarate reductase flavoprotein subunit